MPRHLGPARLRGIAPENAADVQQQARRLLGALMEQLRLGGVKVGKWERTLPDGTRLIAQYDGSTPMVTAIAPRVRPAEEDAAGNAAVWVPRGFVVYPAAASSPTGWGLPVVQVDVEGAPAPYDAANLDPGLDLDRWTAGGPLGQVLLTEDVDAGYPALRTGDQIAPLMYTPGNGLEPDPEAEPVAIGARAAYRLSFTGFAEGAPPMTAAARAAAIAFRRGIFERVNDWRVGIGRDAVFMPLRGRYDSAQTTADLMRLAGVLGHFSERFPATYRAPDDRAMHDGLGSAALAFRRPSPDSRNSNTFENITCTAFPPTPLIGVDPNGVDILSIPNPGPAVTAEQAFEAWITSPLHRALIESEAADMRDGRACVTQIGWRENFASQHFLPQDQWIGCGNRTWTSRHAEIPVVSWQGYPSLNLEWETMPGVPVASSLDFGPFDVVHPFATIQPDPDYPAAGVPVTTVLQAFGGAPTSALTRNIYMHGRCVAMAPRNGLVWAAAVQKIEAPGAATVYRLVALTHHVEDQPDDRKANGCTRYLRCWWVDLPDLLAFAADPRSFIRGEYGTEDEGFAWDDLESPYSWRGGTLLDVGLSAGIAPNRLRCNSQWVFDSEGRNAACIRSVGTYSELDAGRPLFYQWWITSTRGALVTLALPDAGDGLAPAIAHHAPPASNTSRDCENVYPGLDADLVGRVIAVDYDETDALKFAFALSYTLTEGGTFSPDAIPVSSPHFIAFGFNGNYDWLPSTAVGAAGTVLFHRSFRAFAGEEGAGEEVLNACFRVAILDVRDEVAYAVGVHQRGEATFYDAANGIVYVTTNAAYVNCWAENGGDVVRVRVWRGGEVVDSRWYPNPDGAVPNNDPEQLCFISTGGTYSNFLHLPLTANPVVQASYVRRGSDWMLSYVVAPSTAVLWFDPTINGDACNFPGHPEMACTPVASQILTAAPITPTPRGGRASSSFADNAALMAATGTPAAGWFNYSRVV